MNKPLIDWNTISADEKRKIRELYKTKTDVEKKVLEDTFVYDNLNSEQS